MSYFIYTLIHGFRLYQKSCFFLAAFSLIFLLPTSYLLFEFNGFDTLLAGCSWVVFELLGLQTGTTQLILLYCLAFSVIYLPASIWIACCTTTCLALSNGYFPKFQGIARTTFSRFGSVLIARLLAQCLILMPVLIISFFTTRFPHIIPMYGKVVIPAIAYFSFYLSLRYTFVEVIVIAERASPIKALTLCNKITDGATLRIFLLQQCYLIGFILLNWSVYSLLNNTLHLSTSTTNWIVTTLLGGIDSSYIVITYYMYLSFSAGESYSKLEDTCEQIFGTL